MDNNNNSLQLLDYFNSSDKDKSGFIDADELQGCLSNGTWIPFLRETIVLLISLFDRTKRNKLNYEEFCRLWQYITQWQQVFQYYYYYDGGDENKKELSLTVEKVTEALRNSNYPLSSKVVEFLCHKVKPTTTQNQQNSLNFDEFIHLCVMVQKCSKVFQKMKEKKKNRDDSSSSSTNNNEEVIVMNFEEYLQSVFELLVVIEQQQQQEQDR
jgi:Ca2+-binding EF-hand superfamily protein